MLNVTDQCFISPATSKGGFSFNLGDLSRSVIDVTCHVTHGRPSVLSLQDSQELEA